MRENPNPRPVPVDLVKVRTRAESASNDHFDDGAGAISDDFSSFDNHKPAVLSKELLHPQRQRRMEVGLGGMYVSINITDYSRMELQDLKWRLISELEKVRVLMSRIKTGDLQILKYAGCSASSFGVGSGGGREGMSAGALPLILPQFSSEPLEHRPSTSSDQYLKMPESFLRQNDEYNHRKHSKRSQPLSSPREAKRHVPIAESEKILGDIMRTCSQILMKLIKHKWGWVFNTPVDAAGMRLDDYHQIIKRPMDLGTVKCQLEKNAYSSPMDFAADVRLTFNNALLYNPAGHKVHMMAEMLLNLFEKLFAEASDACGMPKLTHVNGSSEDRKKKRSAWPQRPVARRLNKVPPAGIAASPAPASLLPPVVPVSASPLLHTIAHVHSSVDPPAPHQPLAPPSPKLQPTPPAVARSARGKQPKPKAKDPNKRQMSFHEKKKLSMELQNLPQEKMAHVLQIVQRTNADPAVHGNEIELDFEILDMETLWELDRFVFNCKKMMSKMRRQEAMLAMAPPMVEITEKTEIMLPAMVMMTGPSAHNRKDKKGGEPGEENVDIGEEMPSSQFPPTEIGKATGYRSDLTRSSSKSSSSGMPTTHFPYARRRGKHLSFFRHPNADSDSRSSSESCSDADVQSPAVG